MNRREALQRAAWVLGYTVSIPALSQVLEACQSRPDLAFSPQFLKPEQAGLVAEVAEIIIPKTDTPGAKDAGVPQFIDILVKDCYTKEDQDNFLNGLAEFDKGAKDAYGDAFLDLDAAKQVEYVTKVHGEVIEAAKAPEFREKPRPFMHIMKELTVVGFFTSQPGATQVLQYDEVPGAYKGCIPLAEVGKTWAT
ncbi:MAG TPA: gluconate 2-dehydrogenase subunit 3 family protein [Cyclobacteriaceae bacterium]|nr:gluconate 2-dehydrogenase subunit 3 family protein [Cyclobacteriaceae bacterium]